MYSIDRDTAAKTLEISTRTVDRYIRSWKIRTIKKWKKILLNNQDVEILKSWWIQEDYEVIKPQVEENTGFTIKPLDGTRNYKSLYEDSLRVIEKKDEVIKDLSYRLWKTEVELKNSIPLLEYKKTTFLLESSNNRTEEEKKELHSSLDSIKEKLRNQEMINIILVWIFSLMLVVIFIVWFANI